MGVDELAALVLRLGQVKLGLLAPGGPLAVLGDLGEGGLGLVELALLEEALGGLELGVGLGVLAGLIGFQPLEPRIKGLGGSIESGSECGFALGVSQRAMRLRSSSTSSSVGPFESDESVPCRQSESELAAGALSSRRGRDEGRQGEPASRSAGAARRRGSGCRWPLSQGHRVRLRDRAGVAGDVPAGD